MSESSGFFISKGGDRKYTTDWLAKYIHALVTTGVYNDECGVTAGTGMTVSVAAGRAWIEGYLYLLDAPKTLTISNADASNGRKDIVVLRLDLTTRTITVQVIEGTPSAAPTAPAITRTADIYDLELAEISIPAGTSAITQALITDKRLDDTVCGVTVSTVQHIPTASFLEQMLAEFNDWFLEVKGKLSEDAAGNLLQMIQSLSYTVEFNTSDWVVGESECTITIPAITHGMSGNVVDCKAFMLVSGVYEPGVWAALETYATIDSNNIITLHYPGSSGYTGRAVLSAYMSQALT